MDTYCEISVHFNSIDCDIVSFIVFSELYFLALTKPKATEKFEVLKTPKINYNLYVIYSSIQKVTRIRCFNFCEPTCLLVVNPKMVFFY